jgi:hypothetical protein
MMSTMCYSGFSCLSMAEKEPDLNTIRAMLSQSRLTLRDAQSYSFEAARFAFGTVLSLMLDGTLVTGDDHRKSEEQRDNVHNHGSGSSNSYN